jgi:hypothetical protein
MEASMRRILLGALLGVPFLAGCTYVERQPGYAQSGYSQPTYVQPGYAQQGYGYGYAQPAPVTRGYRDGSYEAEAQAYEAGRRDGAAVNSGWR